MSKKLAVMQPYIFPYLGYFQLIQAVDYFVFYDDVNFIKQGWVNRNRILVNGTDHMLSVPCKKISQNKYINEIEVNKNSKDYRKLKKSIRFSYSNAPYFKDVFPVLEEVLDSDFTTISELAIQSVIRVCEYVGIEKEFKISSVHYPETKKLDRSDRLIAITKSEDCSVYINSAGGKDLYSKEYFMDNDIKLSFLDPKIDEYSQDQEEFIPGLSIIDILMFNSPEKAFEMMNDYSYS